MPDEPEALGLVALMLFQDSRRAARAGEELVLLGVQDRTLWDEDRITEGQRVLGRIHRPGPYALQAAIAAEHTRGTTDWGRIAELYESLAAWSRSPVVELNRAVAVAMSEGPARGLQLIDRIELDGYHLLHSARPTCCAGSTVSTRPKRSTGSRSSSPRPTSSAASSSGGSAERLDEPRDAPVGLVARGGPEADGVLVIA